jgi:uncharacterized protein (DUF427 family)
VVEVLELTAAVARARDRWRYRGNERPSFAEPCGVGEESVWDFPRPPRIEPVPQPLRVLLHGPEQQTLAASERCVRVVETAGAPTYYFPPDDVAAALLIDLPGRTLCEWKGLATSFVLRDGGNDPVGWRYTVTFAEFVAIRGWYAFYPGALTCYIDDEQVQPQPGGYYGGWVSANLKGPIKGAPGSEHW